MVRKSVYALIVTAMMVTGLGTAGAAAPPVSQSYIVVLNPGSADVAAVAADLARAHGGRVGLVYEHALEGFSVTLSPGGAAAMAKNPLVSYVEADQEVAIAVQDIPTGIKRIFADENPEITINGSDDLRVDVDVAVIDTGIDFDHPDLNVVARTDCSGGSPFKMSCSNGSGDDGSGHGTHVAGTIGAIDDGNGVVGVAPGARLHAVKVLGDNGSGYISWIVAGIDWVTERAGTIEVANMSLGCECSSPALDSAIAKSVDAGVAYAVAAGNSDKDASTFSPANHPDVLTVSALADFDGEPGAVVTDTSSYCRDDQDDTLADFSNWGSLIEIAAPGVCILSTWKDGGYNTISGTSMASPHAAGALALLASKTDTSAASDPKLAVKSLYTTLQDNGNFNWTDDSGDGIKERLLDVSKSTVFNPATVLGGSGGGGDANSPPTASFTHSCTNLTCDFTGSGSTDSDGTIASYAWDFGDGTATATGDTVSHTYSADGTYTVTLTVTDDDGATGSESKSVSVGLTLTGSSVSNGSTWTATATLSGPEGSSTSGNWNTGASGGCTIASGASSCSFTLSEIPKRVSSVTYTDSTASTLTVTISKP